MGKHLPVACLKEFMTVGRDSIEEENRATGAFVRFQHRCSIAYGV